MARNAFHIAAERARLSFAVDRWNCLTASEQSDAIYRELRLLDAEAARSRRMSPGRVAPHFRLSKTSAPSAH